jgi:hypothetical protein
MLGPKLPPSALDEILSKIDDLYTKVKNRFLGYQPGKRLIVGYTRDNSLGGIYEAASQEENVKPDTAKLDRLTYIASTYLDAARDRTKARMASEVEAILHDIGTGKIAGKEADAALGAKIDDVLGRAQNDIRNIIEHETNKTKNIGLLDGIIAINSAQGIGDPTIVFLVVHDHALCEECQRLHLMEDLITPRAWKLSEVSAGYHKKGDSEPKLGGLHPNCRCTHVTVMPGYGYVDGRLRYIKSGYDLYEAQNGG